MNAENDRPRKSSFPVSDLSDFSDPPDVSKSSTRISRSYSGSFSNLDDPALLQKLLDMDDESRAAMYRQLPEQQAIRIAESVNAMLSESDEPSGRGHQRRLTQVAQLAQHINEINKQNGDDVDIHQQSLSHSRKILHDLSIFLVEDKKVVIERLCIKYPDRGLDFDLTHVEEELDQLRNDQHEGIVTEEILSQELGQLHQVFKDLDKLHEDERDLYETRIEQLEHNLAEVRSDLENARMRIVEEKKKNTSPDINKYLSNDDIIQEQIEILEIEKDTLVEKLSESNDALEKCKIQLNEMNHQVGQKDIVLLEKDDRIKELEHELEDANMQIDDLYATNDDLQEERNDLERELVYWEQEESGPLLEEANLQIKNMKAQLEQVENEKRKLISQLRDLRVDVTATLASAQSPHLVLEHASEGSTAQRLLDASSPTPSNMLDQLGDSFQFYPGNDDSEDSEIDEEKKQLDPRQTGEEVRQLGKEELTKLKKELADNEKRRQNLKHENSNLRKTLQDTRLSKIKIIKALSGEIDRMRTIFKEPVHEPSRAFTIS